MMRGFYTAASGMFAQQRRTEMLTNNMANANTPGYKADQSSVRAFPEMLLRRFDAPSSQAGGRVALPMNRLVGSLNTGTYLQEVSPRFTQGDLRQTDRQTDLALTDAAGGTVFFTVDQNGDTKYTRNGSFTLDPEGLLTTGSGWPVLDENGNRIRLASDQFTVDSNGVIREGGAEVARLGIAVANNPLELIKEGSGLYRTEDGNALPAANQNAQYSVSQGFVEGSTVDVSRSMTDMLAAYRTFEANQKILQAYDRSMEKAVNEIGRVNG